MITPINRNLELPIVTVVTPNFNGDEFLERTILSVLNQEYPNLEYIIIDGGSTDKSIEIIKKYEHEVTKWISEPDDGMYSAIQKGFNFSTGDIMCYINSDDILHPDCLKKVVKFFMANQDKLWIQGIPNVINANDEKIYERKPVFKKWYFYLGLWEYNYKFIQQESTFWKRTLWHKAGSKFNLSLKLAGDFDLWLRFFEFSDLYNVDEYLGAFRIRPNQKSSNTAQYIKECNKSLRSHISRMPLFFRLLISFLRGTVIFYFRVIKAYIIIKNKIFNFRG